MKTILIMDYLDKMLYSAVHYYKYDLEKEEKIPLQLNNLNEAITIFKKSLMHEAHRSIIQPTTSEKPLFYSVNLNTDTPGIITHINNNEVSIYTNNELNNLPAKKDRKKREIDFEKCLKEYEEKKKVLKEKKELKLEEKKVMKEIKEIEQYNKKCEKKKDKIEEKINNCKTLLNEEKDEKKIKKISDKCKTFENIKENVILKKDELEECYKKKEIVKEKKEKFKPPKKIIEPKKETEPKKEKQPKKKKEPKIIEEKTETYSEIKDIHNIQLYPSPIPFERHLNALELCSPNPIFLPILLYGDNKYNKDFEYLKLIHGPPGTGKTYQLILELKEILKEHPRAKILLCCASNNGTINLYERAKSMGINGTLLLSSTKDITEKKNIIFTTISMRFGSLLNKERFSIVLIDEACQCQEAWLWGLFRKEVIKVILAGDHQQLPAYVTEKGKSFMYDRSLMTRLIELKFPTHFLNTQRRMHPDIVKFSNHFFYNNQLLTEYNCSIDFKEKPFEIIDVKGKEIQIGTSFYNLEEIDKIIELYHTFSKYKREVVIISPYSEHCKQIINKNKDLNVHTIDSYQGKEADIIILTTVRTKDKIGFWNDYRRLNVGMTRAKHILRIVGHLDTWNSQEGPLKDVLQFYKQNY